MTRSTRNFDLAVANLSRLLEWNGRFDTRVALLSALAISMLAFESTNLPSFDRWRWTFGVAVVASYGAIGGALVCLYMSVYPRTAAPGRSMFFFGTIATYPRGDFESDFRGMSEDQAMADILSQCHVNAIILEKKFQLLKMSYRLLFAGIPFWLAVLILVGRTPPG